MNEKQEDCWGKQRIFVSTEAEGIHMYRKSLPVSIEFKELNKFLWYPVPELVLVTVMLVTTLGESANFESEKVHLDTRDKIKATFFLCSVN
jgi:hypothetical protein